jgi:FkbM family methyltransferase
MSYAIANSGESFVTIDGDPWIGEALLQHGHFEFDLFEAAISIVGGREMLYDIGANIGVTCIPAVKRKHVRQAVAIEPDPLNYRLLKTNIVLNELEHRIETCRVAAGEEDKLVALELCVDNSGDHRLQAHEPKRNRETREVQMRKLSGYLEDPNEEDLVWMDVQGYEARVLQGWPEVLDRQVPLVMEVCPFMINEYGTMELLIEQMRRYERFVDLRGDLSVMDTGDVGEWIAAIPGTHTDLLFW